MQGVTPKAGVHEEQKEKDQVKPSNVINITALFFEKDSGLLKDIYAARQLSYDEAHRKVRLTDCGANFTQCWKIHFMAHPSRPSGKHARNFVLT